MIQTHTTHRKKQYGPILPPSSVGDHKNWDLYHVSLIRSTSKLYDSSRRLVTLQSKDTPTPSHASLKFLCQMLWFCEKMTWTRDAKSLYKLM
jgi:hypothetical protein